MISHTDISDIDLRRKVKKKEICLGGNKKLRIFGTLQCKSGKRMQRKNRVFFSSEKEAWDNGYRPCGHCMRRDYQKWKNGLV
ncbi:MAG: Ada metal-binding domain-containing protein [Bacteroidota bacterium]